MTSNTDNYWLNYYYDDAIVGSQEYQRNVGRTKNGSVVSDDVWSRTLEYISETTSLSKDAVLVELCCGNGEVVGNLASKCLKAVGVDYSEKLLKQMDIRFGSKVETINSNVLKVEITPKSVDVIIIYFSIQHFTEKQTVELIDKTLRWLKSGGRIFIGDIPDELEKWNYISTAAYRRDYIERLVADKPMIGTWFNQEFFKALADYFKGIKVKVISQPSYQINSSSRFDVLIQKENENA